MNLLEEATPAVPGYLKEVGMSRKEYINRKLIPLNFLRQAGFQKFK